MTDGNAPESRLAGKMVKVAVMVAICVIAIGVYGLINGHLAQNGPGQKANTAGKLKTEVDDARVRDIDPGNGAMNRELVPSKARFGVAAGSDRELMYRLVQQPLDSVSGPEIVQEIRRLKESGVNPDELYDTGMNAFHAAVIAGRIDAVKLLLTLGVSINAGTAERWTALHIASKLGHAQIVKILLDHGADVSLRTRDGKTAYEVALDAKPHNSIVKY